MNINDKEVTVTLTIKELGTTLEGLMGYISWLETAIEDGAKNQKFLESELASCKTAFDKLDKVWWEKSGAEENL
jgi:hypothetical protein